MVTVDLEVDGKVYSVDQDKVSGLRKLIRLDKEKALRVLSANESKPAPEEPDSSFGSTPFGGEVSDAGSE